MIFLASSRIRLGEIAVKNTALSEKQMWVPSAHIKCFKCCVIPDPGAPKTLLINSMSILKVTHKHTNAHTNKLQSKYFLEKI